MSEIQGVIDNALDNTAGVFYLSENTLAVLFYLITQGENPDVWKSTPEDEIEQSEMNTVLDMLEVASFEVMNMIDLYPVGVQMGWPTNSPPDHWMLCDGASLVRLDYPKLFSLIGVTFGSADAAHFNLPDFRDRSQMMPGSQSVTAIGQQAGTLAVSLTVNQLPAHDHDYADPGHNHTINDSGHFHGTTVGAGGSGATSQIANSNQASTATRNTSTNPTGISINTHATGITFHSQGGNAPHSNLSPMLGMNTIIYVGIIP